MTVLGLDIGDRRVGVAITDRQTGLVRVLPTLPNNRGLVGALARLRDERQITTIVVGWPVHLNGQPSAQARSVQTVVDKLERRLPGIRIEFEDERLTSRLAEERLKGVSHTKADIDATAALVILESWLARHKS